MKGIPNWKKKRTKNALKKNLLQTLLKSLGSGFLGISSGNAQFSKNCLKFDRPSVFFYKDLWCERTTVWEIF